MSEGDFSQKLDQVLSDPARLAQIAALAKSFSADGGVGQTPAAPPASEAVSTEAPAAEKMSLLSFIPPEMLRDWKAHAGERMALLRAVRPFLEPEKQAKVDRVLSLLRTLDLLTMTQM